MESEEHKFLGLTNQGATCYMNSLLQTLYMTPEFKRALYSWAYNENFGINKEDSIPLQLQLLFGRLDLLQRSNQFIDTIAVIKSFQWDSEASFTQHDVQEFCRVLFDALDDSVSGSIFTSELYQGTAESYVKCSECNCESVSKEMFMDLSIGLKDEETSRTIDSLEKGLKEYLKPTNLDGDNKYSCENCSKKVKAKKGIRLVVLPPILTFTLNRFSYDFSTFARLNVLEIIEATTKDPPSNSKPFQDQLSVCSFHSRNDDLEFSFSRKRPGSAKGEKKILPTNSRKPPSESGENDRNSLDFEHSSTTASVQFPSAFPQDEDIVELVKKYGSHVYELYAVMVHSGSAWSGHYNSLVKDAQTEKWYCFDDQKVTVVGLEEVFATFGEDKSKSQSGTSAYMLFYRRYNPNRENPMEIEPPHNIQVSILKEKESLLRQREEKKSLLHLRVLYETSNIQIPKEHFIAINKCESILKLKEKLSSTLQLPIHEISIQVISQKNKFKLALDTSKLLKEIPLKMLDTLLISSLKSSLQTSPKTSKKNSLHIQDDLTVKSSRLNTFLSKNLQSQKGIEEIKSSTSLRKSSMGQKSHLSPENSKKLEFNKIKKPINNCLTFKIVLWKQGLFSLEDSVLKPIELKLPYNSSLKELRNSITKATGIPECSLTFN